MFFRRVMFRVNEIFDSYLVQVLGLEPNSIPVPVSSQHSKINLDNSRSLGQIGGSQSHR